MKINVEMTSDEFAEFLQYRADKEIYEHELLEIDKKYEYTNKKILWALGPDAKHVGKVKIINQEHADELVDMANEWFA